MLPGWLLTNGTDGTEIPMAGDARSVEATSASKMGAFLELFLSTLGSVFPEIWRDRLLVGSASAIGDGASVKSRGTAFPPVVDGGPTVESASCEEATTPCKESATLLSGL